MKSSWEYEPNSNFAYDDYSFFGNQKIILISSYNKRNG